MPSEPVNPAVLPVPRTPEEKADWLSRHQANLRRRDQGGVEALFLGDSLTQDWATQGQAAWDAHLAPLAAAAFGIGWDFTQHLLWRVTQGQELAGLSPRHVVLLIGTNNLWANSAAEIAEGVSSVLDSVSTQLPLARVVLMALIPRGARDDVALRLKIADVNQRIARLADGHRVRWLDLTPLLADDSGALRPELTTDGTHLTPAGYLVWAQAVTPLLT